MTIHFDPATPPPDPADQRLQFEEVTSIDGAKFKEIIEPFSDQLKQEHKSLQSRVEHLGSKLELLDPYAHMNRGAWCAIGGTALLAMSLFFPLTPFLAWAFVGCSGLLYWQGGKDYSQLKNISAAATQLQRNEKKQQGVDSPDFLSLSSFQNYPSFYDALRNRMQNKKLYQRDVKALLFLYLLIIKDPTPRPELDRAFTDLQNEWDNKIAQIDWDAKLNSL